MFGEPRNPVDKEISTLEKEIYSLNEKISQLREKLPEEEVKNYELTDLNGNKTSLLDIFGNHDELILVHNMGPGCSYCTMWADGFNSMLPYLTSRCAFAVETDKPMDEWKPFIEKRGWKFDCYSSSREMKVELNFVGEHDGQEMNMPGVSTFFKKDGKVFRHATAPFGPGDAYCPPWQFFDLLKNKANGWQPKFNL